MSSGRDNDGDRLPYRAGLDGLRALAVAGVFLYHANVSWMPGGFLGVDLFFVLSGYLITSLLLHEFSSRGAINLVAFWGRRARRLFPAVALVILFALLATLTIARDDLGRTRSDALSALVYLTNWHEIIASHSYFNEFGRPSLLQHLWSLAVEEQFYLFWPLMLIAGLRWWTKRGLIALTVALAAGSCALMWLRYNPGGDPSALYYGTDTRAFTLLIGALLAFAWPSLQASLARLRAGATATAGRIVAADTLAADAVGVVALLGVLALFVRLQDYDPWLYRGGFLLMAVLGALLVAAAAQPGSNLGRAFGCAPLRWIGARSYGIYLWHWPILELTRPGADVPLHGAPLIVLQAAVTVAAAALSYRYVEMPVRSGEAQKQLKDFLDRHTPHERLAWVAGTAAALVTFAGIGFGLPAPVASAAFSSNATPSALQVLSSDQPGQLSYSFPPLAGAGSLSAARLAGTAGGIGSGVRPVGSPRIVAPGSQAKRGASPPPNAILAIGDSVMLGCAPNLTALLGHSLRVDAIVGRQAEATITRLAQYRAAGRLPSQVIVQIGDNGPVWYSDMQNLRKVLKGVPVVVLVNVRVARSWQNEVNAELKSYARTWPQAVVANWYAHSTQSMLSDGVHPWIDDRGVYAKVVDAALKQAQHNAAAGNPKQGGGKSGSQRA
ncbi:MAG TPA: acyltransferase family protein [Solirubrobacteraceae bacterium]|nr:acyltransferase family protein [Solirubrobacteraceae bacterium]